VAALKIEFVRTNFRGVSAGQFERMAAEQHLFSQHCLDFRRRPSIAAGIGKMGAVIGQDGMNLVGNRCDECSQETTGDTAGCLLVKFYEGEF